MFFFIFICFELEYTVLINHLLTEMHMQVHRDCIFWVWGRGDKPIWSIGFVVDPVDIQWAVWIFEVHIVVYLSALGLKAMLFRKGFEKTKQQKGREVVTVQLSTLYHIYIYTIVVISYCYLYELIRMTTTIVYIYITFGNYSYSGYHL